MQIFIDSADATELKTLAQTGLVDGVTTNPSLVAKAGRDFFETLAEICAAVPGPVSAEVVAQDAETMIKEGLKLRGVAPNIVEASWRALVDGITYGLQRQGVSAR